MTNKNVEFVGLPGVGKTTIKEYFKQKDKMHYQDVFFVPDNNQTIFSNIKKAFIFIIFLFENITLTYHVFKFSLSVKPLNKQSLYRAFRLIRLCHLLKLNRGRNIVLDQGIIQLIWSIVISGNYKPKRKSLKNVIKSIDEFLPRYIVYCSAEMETILSRIECRETNLYSRLDNMSKSQRKAMLFNNEDYLFKIISIIKEKDIFLINLDTEQEVNENIQKLFMELFNTKCTDS